MKLVERLQKDLPDIALEIYEERGIDQELFEEAHYVAIFHPLTFTTEEDYRHRIERAIKVCARLDALGYQGHSINEFNGTIHFCNL